MVDRALASWPANVYIPPHAQALAVPFFKVALLAWRSLLVHAPGRLEASWTWRFFTVNLGMYEWFVRKRYHVLFLVLKFRTNSPPMNKA